MLLRIGVAILMCTGAGMNVNAASSEYRLGPLDKLRLSVSEWRAATSEVYLWEPLTGDFSVTSGGNLSLPLVGTVEAGGLTTAELSSFISKRLQEVIGLAKAPSVAVEITQYRPFYILGNIEKPGEFPFRPGLTVSQAVGVAGGFQRLADSTFLRLGREVITQSGEVHQLLSALDTLRVRKARLDAEISLSNAIELPIDLKKRSEEPGLKLAIEEETATLLARNKALTTEIEALTSLQAFLNKEIKSLEEQVEVQKRERSLVQKEFATVAALVEKGLSASARQSGVERSLAQMEGDRLRLETSVLRARQDASKVNINLLETKNKRATEVTSLIRETTVRITETESKLKIARKLLIETQVSAPRALSLRRNKLNIQTEYIITRSVNGVLSPLNATENTAVEPGDTVQVTVTLPDEFDQAVN